MYAGAAPHTRGMGVDHSEMASEYALRSLRGRPLRFPPPSAASVSYLAMTKQFSALKLRGMS